MTPVVWTESAHADLQAIQAYVSRDSAHYADLLVERIVGAVGRIALFPRSGRVVPEFLDDDLRELTQGNYRIVYRLTVERAELIAVVHGARMLGSP